MTGEKKIVGLWSSMSHGADRAEALSAMTNAAIQAPGPEIEQMTQTVSIDDFDADGADGEAAAAPSRWPARLMLGGSAAWTAFVGFASTQSFTVMPSVPEWPMIIAAISAPIALGLLTWLFLRHSSKAEQLRFSRIASDLRTENQALSHSMLSLGQHLADARHQLGEQAVLLQKLGVDTVLRLNESSEKLAQHASLVAKAGDTLAGSTHGALQRMDGLLSGLPRIDDVAQRLSSNFREAGLVAHQHGAQLEVQLASMTEEAARAAEQANSAAAGLREALDALRALSDDTQSSLVTATKKVAEAQTASLSAMSRGTSAVQKELETSTNQLSHAIEGMWQNFRGGVTETSEHLHAEMDKAKAAGDALTAQISSQGGQAEQLAAQLQQLMAGVAGQLSGLDDAFSISTDRISRAIDATKGKLDAFAADVGSGNRSAQQLISHSDALLLALDSVTRELDETLPLAFQRLDTHEKSAEQAVARLRPLLEASELVAQSTLSHIHAAEKTLHANEAHLLVHAEKQEKMTENLRLAMRDSEASLGGLREGAALFASESGAQMLASIHKVRDTADNVATDTRDAFHALAEKSREAMHHHAASAVDEAFQAEMVAQLEAIELASHRAVAAANSASERLTRQLGAIIEASETVEARTAEAQQAIAATDRDTLAKQVGLLTEALKSTAIDMTKILSNEVSDAAWEAYLRGDRGVFARRAVKLLDHGEAREILRLYQNDDAFHASVNQFIHDFEAMLRLLMNARDGSAISVTLLSSDIGKLYVALAQAIDRLRN